jgi:hypothetical protein
MHMRSLFLVAALVLPLTAAAAVYKSIDANGVVIYSDTPRAGAEPVEMVPLSTYQPAPVPASMPPPATPAAAGPAYSELRITSPGAEETIVPGQAGEVPVSVALAPPLQAEAGHRVQVLLDGAAVGAPMAELTVTLPNVDRGRHSVSAQVVDAQGRVVASSAGVTFFVQRSSAMFEPPPPPDGDGDGDDTGGTPEGWPRQAPRAPMMPRAPRMP